VELRALIAAVNEQLEQERIHAEQSGQHQHAAIAILDIGWMDHGMQQQT
jgi:hypothetical protein